MIRTRDDHELEGVLTNVDWILGCHTDVVVVTPTLAQARRELAGVPGKAWRRVTTVDEARALKPGQSAYLLIGGPWPSRSLAARDDVLAALQARGIPQVETDEIIALHNRVRERS